jgi:hypothetical protein
MSSRSTKPFRDWLFSRQDIRIKIQATLAVLLLLLAGGITIYELDNRQSRERAYTQIIDAVAQGSELSIIEGAETFLLTPFFAKQDARQPQVIKLYHEAIVRWFIEQTDELDADEQVHLERYRTLVTNQ